MAKWLAVLPNVRHTIASDYRSVLSIVIEPESVCPGVLEDLDERLSGPEGEAFVRSAFAPPIANCASVMVATISPAPNSI